MKDADLVVISTFPSVADAEIAQGLLEAASIPSFIRSDNAGGMFPALDEAALLVTADDAQRANETLGAPAPELPATTETGN